MDSLEPASPLEHCLLGGLLGDAWGGPYEGQPGPVVPTFPRNPRISDDTQLVLATCEAILEQRGRVDPAAVAERFRIWFESGRLTGLGSSTLKAVRDLAAGAHWALSGARGEFAAGAGAAMRAAPLAFFLDPDRNEDRQTLRDVARITHHNDEAYAGTLAMVLAVRSSWRLASVPGDLLARVATAIPGTAVRERIVELARCTPEQSARLGVSGHVVDAVPLALRLASIPGVSCTDAIRSAVSFGGDTDTIASLAAQVIGASGAAAPRALLERVPETAVATQVFRRVARLLNHPD
jgi:ADP-ribosylglycohydrolase